MKTEENKLPGFTQLHWTRAITGQHLQGCFWVTQHTSAKSLKFNPNILEQDV